MTHINKREVFGSKFAAIATTVGSAVGLGNIWRFPYEAGTHGGGAFMLCYLCFIFLLGVPLLCAEYSMGRATRSNIFGAYRKLSPKKKWYITGYLGIFTSLMILSFYSVVAGWTVEYCVMSVGNIFNFSDASYGHEQFQSLTNGWRPVVWTVIFLFCNTFILLGGVKKGIERASNVMMPLLFVLLIIFCINSLTMPGCSEGLKFLFSPDFSKITSQVMLSALGQAFFSLSLGLGCMLTYASYFSEETRLGRTAAITAGLDSLVAILAGVIIFPAVFSYGVEPTAGPTLVFEVLPNIFGRMNGGAIWAAMFFLLLFVASLTSTVSMSEISIAFFCEEKKMSRRKATMLSASISLVGGVLCALSFGPLSNLNIFNIFDYVSSNIFLPLGGMICSVFVGWFMNKTLLQSELTNNGRYKFRLFKILVIFLRWVCPLAIFMIFLNCIGVL